MRANLDLGTRSVPLQISSGVFLLLLEPETKAFMKQMIRGEDIRTLSEDFTLPIRMLVLSPPIHRKK